jgi:recombinational DNA repair protein RecT
MENTKIAAPAASRIALGYNRKAVELGLIHLINENRLERAYNAALERNPKLEECTKESLGGALLQMLHLDLGLDGVVLEPVFDRSKNGYVCVFRLGYKGYLELARRCGGESAKSA